MNKLTRKRNKKLRLEELIAIALGGMVGGGIFSILGIATENIGNATPVAILIGGFLALGATYSYVKLALLYKDEGAMYSFFKKTFPERTFASSVIGWLIIYVLNGLEIKLSMDGKGRATDNAFIERLWRGVKNEKQYLSPPEDGINFNDQLNDYFNYYNNERRHYGIENCVPLELFSHQLKVAA